MIPTQMPKNAQAVALGLAATVWMVVGGVCTVVGLVAALLQLSVADFVGGLVAGFLVGGFFAWLTWFILMYLTPAGRAHQAWQREQEAVQRQRYVTQQQVGYANNNDLAVATGLIVGGLYGVQAEMAYLNHPPQHIVPDQQQAYYREQQEIRHLLFPQY